MQTRWASLLEPLLGAPNATPILLERVQLQAGTNLVDHKLQRNLVGWQLSRLRGPTTPTTIITPWTSTTVTGSWTTNTTYTGKYRRVGDTMECLIRVALSGAPDNATLTVTIPEGKSVDTTKINTTSSPVETLGTAVGFDTTGTNSGRLFGETVYASATTVAVRILEESSGSVHYETTVDQTSPVTWANGDSILLRFAVPIVGWAVTDSSFVQVYDTQDTNPAPDKTLRLVASGAALVDILVY